MGTVARVAVAVTLALVATITGVRLAGVTVRHPWVAVLTVFPWLVAVAALATVTAAALRWWPGAVVGVVLVLLGAAVLVPRATAGPTVTAEGPPLTVAVANLRVGAADPAALVAAVEHHGIDVLVTLELTEAAIVSLAAGGLGRHLPHAVLEPSRFTSGGGIHSRLPLRALAPSEDRGFGRTPRAVVQVDADLEVVVEGVHPLPPIRADWTRQWARTLDRLGAPRADERRLLTGDFNATLDHPQLRSLLARGWHDAAAAVGRGLVPTFNALPYGEPVPPVTLDHVLVDPWTQVEAVDVLPLPGSDHRILVVDVRLPAAGRVTA